MTNLIIHVGPGKCGSSSIQYFFGSQKQPCVENTRLHRVPPTIISQLNREKPDDRAVTAIADLLVDNLTGTDTLILSHEYLFQCPYAIKRICDVSKAYVPQIQIIGYSRRQSDFIMSAYSQWWFRSPERVKETTDVIIDLGLDPILFSGLERQLIASIANDFYSARQLVTNYEILNWHNSYLKISQLVQETGAIIMCGIIPEIESSESLIQDFCIKANLTFNQEMKAASKKIVNTSYNHNLVEAINIAVTLGFEMPGRNDRNKDIGFISNKMEEREITTSDFIANLKTYIDTYFLQSNIGLCEEYILPKEYFYPDVQLNKTQIFDIIKNENRRRSVDKSIVINKLRMLSAVLVDTHLDITHEK